MKDGLIERIQGVGHWRVNIRPVEALRERLSFQKCAEIVEANKVSIRGWDFPHVDRRHDEHGEAGRGHDFYESWTDWKDQLEFWRMYRSGQFLSYNALSEDISTDIRRSPTGTVDIVDVIYSVTEFFEFAHRVSASGIYPEGVEVNVALRNIKGHRLEVGFGRMPFSMPRETGAPVIETSAFLGPGIGDGSHAARAVTIVLEIFDHFGWNPSRARIETDQESFYGQRFR